MILFKSVTYKNFLAAGNNPIKIDLNNHGTTLIVGQNGAGKSTIIEALVFALFNKSFRKVNKNQLINSINEKDCLVEVDFSVGSVEWRVRRGIKPNIFEIIKNGKVLDQASSAVDQQKWFEQTVLKLNYKSFTQIVVLGSSTFVPFMQLPAASRREVIEDLLDIKIFSTMNVILKDRIKVTGEELKESESQIQFLKEKAELQKQFIKTIESQNKKTIGQKKEKIESLNNDISDCESKISEMEDQIKQKEEELEGYKSIEKELKTLEKHSHGFSSRIKEFEKSKKFYAENDTCPTCNQNLSEDLKSAAITDGDKQIGKCEKALKKVETEITDIQNKISEKNDLVNLISDLTYEIRKHISSITTNNKFIREIQDEINELKTNKGNIEVEKRKLIEIASEGMSIQKSISRFKDDRRNYDLISSLLKDTGIKSMIIKKYLPVMNKLINQYLQMLDFYVNFTLDEEFNESIKSRFRDDFTYSSFSEGEKMRIDLALMFTWRSVAKLKNSANTNLLILDEVFDSSLDVAGTEDFLRILRGVTDNSNIFIISHKGELLHDKFDRVMRFEKVKNFSKVSIS
jgi:DNA repair exonuclease SbcCD ATPase subunit